MQTRRRLLSLALLTPLAAGVQRALSGDGKVANLAISTDGDLLAYKPDHLTCPTGVTVHLTFRHGGKYISQEHNWVLVVPGATEAVEKVALAAGENAGWVPSGDRRILAATAQCGKGHEVSVTFTAPAPGKYPFLCTNPGHGEVMHGILEVTPS